MLPQRKPSPFKVVTPRVDPARLGFREQWHYILAWAYHKHCLDATHKLKIGGSPPPEVRWLGAGKPLPKERMVDTMWAAAQEATTEAELRVTP